MTETQKETLGERAMRIICNAAAVQEPAASRMLAGVLLLELGTEYLAEFGLGFCGHSVRLTRTDCLLTVKAIEGGIPLVAFVSSRTTMGSMLQFMDLLESGRLQWHRDKYPWI